jgi:hypothetical protein
VTVPRAAGDSTGTAGNHALCIKLRPAPDRGQAQRAGDDRRQTFGRAARDAKTASAAAPPPSGHSHDRLSRRRDDRVVSALSALRVLAVAVQFRHCPCARAIIAAVLRAWPRVALTALVCALGRAVVLCHDVLLRAAGSLRATYVPVVGDATRGPEHLKRSASLSPEARDVARRITATAFARIILPSP